MRVSEIVVEDFDAVHPVRAQRRLRLRAGDELEVVVDRLGRRIAAGVRLVDQVEAATVAARLELGCIVDEVGQVTVDHGPHGAGPRSGRETTRRSEEGDREEPARGTCAQDSMQSSHGENLFLRH